VNDWIKQNTWLNQTSDPFALPVYSETLRGSLKLLRRGFIGRWLSGKYIRSIIKYGFPAVARWTMLAACAFDEWPTDEEMATKFFQGQRKGKSVSFIKPDESMYDVIQRYASLPCDFKTKEGLSEDLIKELLIGSTANQEYFVCSETDALVTVMGHTHNHYLRKFEKYKKGAGQIIYANSGGWTDSCKKTFVDIKMSTGLTTYPPSVAKFAAKWKAPLNTPVRVMDEYPLRVELWEWNDGFPSLLAALNTEYLTKVTPTTWDWLKDKIKNIGEEIDEWKEQEKPDPLEDEEGDESCEELHKETWTEWLHRLGAHVF